MGFKLIETIDNGYYDVAKVFQCTNCGRIVTLAGVGGDIACCPCEFSGDRN